MKLTRDRLTARRYLVLVLALVGVAAGCSNHHTNLRAVLSPATVAPVSDECTLTLTKEADGNVTPLLCSTGGVNVLAWQYYRQGHVGKKPVTKSQTMALGRTASPSRVLRAMCADYSNIYGTNPLTVSAEHLAAAYYGWNFGSNNPAATFQGAGCAQP